MKRKILALTLTVIMGATALMGCSNTEREEVKDIS